MPSKKQADSNTNIPSFSPVLGGNYNDGILNNENAYGFWWNSEANTGARRYRLYYNGSSLSNNNTSNYIGIYIRCVSEEKTVADLTYLQDMTGEIANNTLDGTTASLIT